MITKKRFCVPGLRHATCQDAQHPIAFVVFQSIYCLRENKSSWEMTLSLALCLCLVYSPLCPNSERHGHITKALRCWSFCDEGIAWSVDPVLLVIRNISRLSLLLRPWHRALEVSEFSKCWVQDRLLVREEWGITYRMCPKKCKTRLRLGLISRDQSQHCPMDRPGRQPTALSHIR